MQFEFLQSERFWKLAIVGAIAGLNVPLPNNPWLIGLSVAIGIWFGGSVAVRTYDRRSEMLNGKNE